MKIRDKKIKAIFDDCNFIARQPFEISVCYSIIAFAIAFCLFGLDLGANVSSGLGMILVLVNLAIIVFVVFHLSNMEEEPTCYSNIFGRFSHKKSFQSTRFLQKELVSQVDNPKFATAKSQGQKYNNSIRLLSFVAVFDREAYLLDFLKIIALEEILTI